MKLVSFGRTLVVTLVGLCAAGMACSAALATPPTLDELLRRPQYEWMNLSPTGEYVAASLPMEDRTALAIVRRADMKVTASVDPGKDGFVDPSFWVGDSRLFAEWSMRFGAVADRSTARSSILCAMTKSTYSS